MTRQIEDLIQIDGELRRLRGWPLEDYLEKLKPQIAFPAIASSCHRGYQAQWRVIENKLLLAAVMAGSESSEDEYGTVTLSMFVDDYLLDVFPEATGPVFANWVSGEFYTENGDKSKSEMQTFKRGLLTARVICEPFDPYRQYQEGLKAMFARLERENLN